MPRPAPSQGDVDALCEALQDLLNEAQLSHPKTLSSREIKKMCTRPISHTTINQLLTGQRVPSWPIVAEVVAVLGGEPPQYGALWKRAAIAEALRQKGESDLKAGSRVRQRAAAAVALSTWVYELEVCELAGVAQVCSERDARGWQIAHLSYPPGESTGDVFTVPTAVLFRRYVQSGEDSM